MYYNDELYHYGVKGMKWGVRRAQRKEERAARKALDKTSVRKTKVGKKMIGGLVRTGALMATGILAKTGVTALSVASVGPAGLAGAAIINSYINAGIMAGHVANLAYTPTAIVGNVISTNIHNAKVRKNLQKRT